MTIFIGLFMYTAISKSLTIGAFTSSLQSLFLSTYLSLFVAYFVIAAEIGLSILFMFEKRKKQALYCSFGLISAFTIYTVIAANSRNRPCTCGGVLSNFTWLQHLFFNLILLALALLGIFVEQQVNHKDTRRDDQSL
jgi:hypothetical protein